MAVKIRLARIGKKNAPFYRIVAVDSRKKRDGAFIEDLGTYDGRSSSLVCVRTERIDDWVSKGAIATDVVKKIYKKHKDAAVATVEAPKAPKATVVKKAKAEKADA